MNLALRRTLVRRLGTIGFVLSHVFALLALFVTQSPAAWILCGVLFVVRMFGVTAGYHRYFSHRAFKTSRVGQFALAVLAQSSLQKGVLWWAAHHRKHHKHSDEVGDVHSPVQEGFWHSHVGWILSAEHEETDYAKVRDLAKYPELRFLNRFHFLPGVVLALICFLTLGVPGLIIGFFVSTVALWHSTFLINSLAHVVGTRRFATPDESRNNFWLALLTLGEGWHNNHHRYQSSARNGFYWWEVDFTYYALRGLSALRLVSDLRQVPERVLAEGRTRADQANDSESGTKVPQRRSPPSSEHSLGLSEPSASVS
ncbi:MAG: stearoyl-CoA desaturase (delta-9 desaturase) [Polyangiales bacterium]|jgi:stearoyl-CoA desaturase (delta-9 desaturase)